MKYFLTLLLLAGAGATVACQSTQQSFEILDDGSMVLPVTGMT